MAVSRGPSRCPLHAAQSSHAFLSLKASSTSLSRPPRSFSCFAIAFCFYPHTSASPARTRSVPPVREERHEPGIELLVRSEGIALDLAADRVDLPAAVVYGC